KMHGICSQRHEGFFMLRHRIGGGRLDPDQMETLCDLAAQYASGYVHLTTRQNVELHSITIEKVPEILDRLDRSGLTTPPACRHPSRNVIGPPCSGTCPAELVDIRPWVSAVSRMVIKSSDYYNPRLPKRLNVSFSGCPCGADHALVNDIG